jgi:hypothetical protein
MSILLEVAQIGGTHYVSCDNLLDFLAERARLVVRELSVHGTSPSETEYLRGQLFAQEIIKNALQSSK